MYTVYIYDTDNTIVKKFNTWWELIKELDNYNDYVFAHNKNDTYIVHDFFYAEDIWGTIVYTKKVYYRNVFVYDEFNRIINLSEIREGIAKYKPRIESTRNKHWHHFYSKKYKFIFQYRHEPVPCTGHYNHNSGYYRGNVTTNKKYYSDLLSYKDEFEDYHCQLKKVNFDDIRDYDGYIRSKHSNGWKENSTVRKQYLKHCA